MVARHAGGGQPGNGGRRRACCPSCHATRRDRLRLRQPRGPVRRGRTGPATRAGPGRIAVRATGVNPTDYKTYSGAFGTDPARLPLRLGSEMAGVVTAVGPGGDWSGRPVPVGDEVIGYRVPGRLRHRADRAGDALPPGPAAWTGRRPPDFC